MDDVHILGQVTNEELTALYDVADLFLCASEHEGFCVPLIEAFYKRVPVLAYAATAVPATMDGGGVLYDTRDPRQVAALMQAMLSDDDLEDRVLAAQDAALARLRAQDFGGMIVRFVNDVLAEPAASARPRRLRLLAAVQADGRARGDSADRPAAFHALPFESDDAVADVGPGVKARIHR